MRRISIVVVVVIAISGSAVFAANRSDDPVASNADSAVSGAAPVTTTRDSNLMQSDIADSVPDLPVEADAPAGAGSTDPQTTGELIDGLRLDDIRWGDHESYYRVVFDLSTTSGEPVNQAPHADAIITSEGTEVVITLGGIRGISGQPNVMEQELEVGSARVISIERLPAMDDQALVYSIKLSAPATYTLSSLGAPGRVIVDIYN
ncbi:MAG: hypothetical protein ACYC4M_05410 [Thermoleophilia bacterium]